MTQTTSNTQGSAELGTLAGRPAFSGYSSDDIAAAVSFYGDTLGLDARSEHGMLSLRFPSARDPAGNILSVIETGGGGA